MLSFQVFKVEVRCESIKLEVKDLIYFYYAQISSLTYPSYDVQIDTPFLHKYG